ncbi:hypothetical protein BDZ89DRAFT_933313, partial [Hymenopellis radicata]
NNCGKWLNGIGAPSDSHYDCDMWDDWASYNATIIASLKSVALASMDTLTNFFFCAWKIGDSTELGRLSSPMWHYRLRLQHGWMPADPREAINYCGGSQLFDSSYAASATGDAASMQPTPSLVFPPAKISPSFDATLLPKY